MRENRIAWFAIGFAIVAFINSIVVGYFGLHSHDELDANDTIISLPRIGAKKGEVLQKDGSGGLRWEDYKLTRYNNSINYPWTVIDDTVHSEAYGSYPAEVPFEQGMTLYPGQSATININDIFDSTKFNFFEIGSETEVKEHEILMDMAKQIDSLVVSFNDSTK